MTFVRRLLRIAVRDLIVLELCLGLVMLALFWRHGVPMSRWSEWAGGSRTYALLAAGVALAGALGEAAWGCWTEARERRERQA